MEVARKYLPQTDPDVVVVNLFLGNDIAEHQIDLKPFQRQYFNTNAGTLMAAPHGKYVKNATNAYDRIMDQSMIPEDLSWMNFLSSQTRISTLLWRVCNKMGIIGNVAHRRVEKYWDFVNETNIGYSVNGDILREIQELCEANECKLIVSVIPEKENLDIDASEIDEKVDGYPYVLISGLSKDDYAADGHFNESGNRKYAEFLKSNIQKLTSVKN
jgi:hypothetical protein